MRIIAGSAKGLKLAAPPGHGTRPVLDRVKESWFACLGERVAGARVLDLYSGVGSLGLEALSRGAGSCVFVEFDPECVAMLMDHLDRSRLADRADARRADAAVALDDLARSAERFDLIFLDPPFKVAVDPAFGAPGGTLSRAVALLAPGGVAMLRREAGTRGGPDEATAAAPEPAELRDRRRWGRNEVLFYERAGTP
ncbi:MAG: RsmD family RNA methyltransferase [Planctomycetota bacterium]